MSTIHTFKNMPAGLIFNIFQDSAQKHLKLYLCNQNQHAKKRGKSQNPPEDLFHVIQ